MKARPWQRPGIKPRAARRLKAKAFHRLQRRAIKANAARRIPCFGCIVSRTLVRRHRYLRDDGLAHSRTVADVLIEPSIKPKELNANDLAKGRSGLR